jgi:hypothetical protein
MKSIFQDSPSWLTTLLVVAGLAVVAVLIFFGQRRYERVQHIDHLLESIREDASQELSCSPDEITVSEAPETYCEGGQAPMNYLEARGCGQKHRYFMEGCWGWQRTRESAFFEVAPLLEDGPTPENCEIHPEDPPRIPGRCQLDLVF